MTAVMGLVAFITCMFTGWWIAFLTTRHFFYTAGFYDGYEASQKVLKGSAICPSE